MKAHVDSPPGWIGSIFIFSADCSQPAGIVKISVCADGSRADAGVPANLKHDEIFIKGVGEPVATCAPPAPSPAPVPSPPANP